MYLCLIVAVSTPAAAEHRPSGTRTSAGFELDPSPRDLLQQVHSEDLRFTDLFLNSETWRVWTRWPLRRKLVLDGNVVNLRRRKWPICKDEVKQKSSFHTLPVSGWSTWVWFKSEQRDEFHHRVNVTRYFTDYMLHQSQRSTFKSIYTQSLLVLNTSEGRLR